MTALADSAPVRKLLNMVLLMAIREHASDLHFEPFEDEFKIRIKADGVLYEMVPPPRHLAFAITTRIKVMANLDIAERRLPQDGRIELTVGGHPVDLRVSVLPTMFGESVVMRVLDRSVTSLDLETVGHGQRRRWPSSASVIEKPNGIVLVTGPTGSGKTTTLYSALNELNTIEDKLITTEDPVEYDMDGIIQVPIDAGHRQYVCPLPAIHSAAGPGQDPGGRDSRPGDGRDRRAGVAHRPPGVQHAAHERRAEHDHAAEGHGRADVFDHGHGRGDPGPAAGAQGVHAMPRGVHAAARDPRRPGAHVRAGPRAPVLSRARAAKLCNNTGYKGRVGLFELMIMNNDLRDRIMANAQIGRAARRWRKNGMVPLRDAGIKACFEGITTPDEVVRETILEA